MTGFEDRDRDFVRDMIKMAGATYTGRDDSESNLKIFLDLKFLVR